MKTKLSRVLSIMIVWGFLPGAGAAPEPATISVGEMNEVHGVVAQDVQMFFPTPMVPESQVNQTVDGASFLETTPPLPTKLTWTSTRSASSDVTRSLNLGQTLSVKLRVGLRDASGQPVVAPPPLVVPGPLFAVTSRHPDWFPMNTATARTPEITLFFNDAVEAKAVEKLASFVDGNGQRIAVLATTPRVGTLGANVPPIGPWAMQRDARLHSVGTAPSATLPPEAAAVSVVTIRPAKPLPPGPQWQLKLAEGLSNVAKSSRAPAYAVAYGTIAPLSVASIVPEPMLSADRRVIIHFTKSLGKQASEDWDSLVTITPRPERLTWTAEGDTQLVASGSFAFGTEYGVQVKLGIQALDASPLIEAKSETIIFPAHEPHLSLPTFSAAQWLHGKGTYNIASANLADLSVRIKKIAPAHAVLALRGYGAYENDEDNSESSENTRIPFPTVPGRMAWEKSFTPEGSHGKKSETANASLVSTSSMSPASPAQS
jgi:hypothetical protein